MLSVIIPAHNEENYIGKTLYSLKQQTYRQFEVIVVANGCTDKTKEIAAKHKDVRVIELTQANVSAARNAGARQARGDILVFLDADTQLDTTSLKVAKDTFTSKFSVATFMGKPDDTKLKYRFLLGIKNLLHKLKISKSVSGSLLCHKEQFNKVGGYNESLHVREHHALITKLLKFGKYTVLSARAITSMRRLKKWGILKQMWYWTAQIFSYIFGGKDKQEYERVR